MSRGCKMSAVGRVRDQLTAGQGRVLRQHQGPEWNRS